MDRRVGTRGDDELAPESQVLDLDWAWLAQIALIAIAVIALVWLLSWARPVLLPIVSAVVLGMIFGPIADRGRAYGVPFFVTNIAVLLGLALFAYAAAALFVPTIIDSFARLPELAVEVRQKLSFLQGILERLNAFGDMLGSKDLTVQVTDGEGRVAAVFAFVTPAFAQLIVFTFTLIFFLAGRSQLKRQLVLMARGRDNRLLTLKMIADIETRLLDYFGTITVINAAVAGVTALMLAALGAPSPLTWGFLAFVLNYIPVIGPLLMKALLLGMGILVMPSIAAALLPVIGYLIITTLESNVITPRVFGKRLTLPPLLIFVTICFLGWLWGPIGALLATPLLGIATIVGEYLMPSEQVQLPG